MTRERTLLRLAAPSSSSSRTSVSRLQTVDEFLHKFVHVINISGVLTAHGMYPRRLSGRQWQPGGVVGRVMGVKSEVELVVRLSPRTARTVGAGDGKRCGVVETLRFVACLLGRSSS